MKSLQHGRRGRLLPGALLAPLLLAPTLRALEIDEASVEGRISYYNPTQASDTFDANFDGGESFMLGAGGIWEFENGLYVEGSLDYYTKDGEKVYIGGGQQVNSGFGTEITIIPITATAGWTFLEDSAASPMVGGGIGYYLVDVPDSESENTLGYHVAGGVEFLKDRSFGMQVELRYSIVPDAIGHAGTSLLFDEDDVGGIALTIKGLWRYRR